MGKLIEIILCFGAMYGAFLAYGMRSKITLATIIILTLSIVNLFSYPKIVNKSSLVGWITFDDVSGSTVNDSSGFGCVSTIVNGSIVNGRFGKALSHTASYNHTVINCANTSQHNVPSGTVVLWVLCTDIEAASGNGSIIIKKGNGFSVLNGWGFRFIGTGTRALQGVISNGTVITSTSTVPANVWSNIVMTWTNSVTSVISFYINGVTSGSGISGDSTVINTAIPTAIGSSGATQAIQGSIDDIRIYNRVLSLTEINQLYQSGKRNH